MYIWISILDYEKINDDVRKFLIKKDLLWIENSQPFYHKLGMIFHTFAPRMGMIDEFIQDRETQCFVDKYTKVIDGGFYSSDLKEPTDIGLCTRFDSSSQDSTTNSFLHLMNNIGHALNVSISVHDLPSLLNKVQYDKSEDFLQNSPCLSLCDYTSSSFNSGSYHAIHQCWKEYAKRNSDDPSFNISNHLINDCGVLNEFWSEPMEDIRNYLQ